MFQDLLNLIFADGCYACGNELNKNEECVCMSCVLKMEETQQVKKPKDNELYYRFAGKVPITGASSLFYFDKFGKLQKLLHALKYKDSPQVGVYLGKFLGEVLVENNFLNGIETLVPVPLHKRKEIQRGYNQSEKIAQGLSQVSGIPINTQLIQRKQFTETQTRKNALSRWLNVSEAFALEGEVPQGILLIDDVITTGATLEACIKALCAGGKIPSEIKVASIAMARGK